MGRSRAPLGWKMLAAFVRSNVSNSVSPQTFHPQGDFETESLLLFILSLTLGKIPEQTKGQIKYN